MGRGPGAGRVEGGPSYPRRFGARQVSEPLPPAPPRPPPGVEETPDFSRIDFVRLWAGRDRVTEVEGALLTEGLARAPDGPMLEIGTGGARLTPYLLRGNRHVVATDATVGLLSALPRSAVGSIPKVGANVYHLPFRPATFAGVAMIRVFGFLTDPGAALREIRRVLRPQGILLVSFEPHPSVGSLLSDLKIGLAGATAPRGPTMTFARDAVVPVRPSAYPAWSSTRRYVADLVEASGFRVESDRPCGLEDLAGLRSLPASVFAGLSRALSRLGGFPSRFLVLRNVSEATEPRAVGPSRSGDTTS
ncbi:MAG TPA: class I SAM-dependent methyltransferase [Thermoplasmata archaeon]|nr:class I SAM-dependent methyltransferase [Thermoplasmata archaeon]